MQLIQYGPENDKVGALKITLLAESDDIDILRAAAEKIALKHGLDGQLWPNLLATKDTNSQVELRKYELYLKLIG